MRSSQSRRHILLATTLVLFPAVQALAQSVQTAAAARPAVGDARSGPGDPKKVLNLADYGRWNRIVQTAISPDGKWMTYAYQPNDGDVTLYVKEIDG